MSTLLKLLAALVVTLSSGEDNDGKLDLSFWRYPYNRSQLIHDHPDDGLPYYFGPAIASDDKAVFTPEIIACPSAMLASCAMNYEEGDDDYDGEYFDDYMESAKKKRKERCNGQYYCRYDEGWLNKHHPDYIPNMQNKTLPTKDKMYFTRRQVLERAIAWVASHAPYHNKLRTKGQWVVEGCSQYEDEFCPQYHFVGACDGLHHMAYRNPKHVFGETSDIFDPIKCEDMLPGDVVASHGPKGITHHWFMFRKWANATSVPIHDRFIEIYQMGGGGGANHHVKSMFSGPSGGRQIECPGTTPKQKGKDCQACKRYKYLKEETATSLIV